MAYWILISIQNRSILANQIQSSECWIFIYENQFQIPKYQIWSLKCCHTLQNYLIWFYILESNRSMWAMSRNVWIYKIGTPLMKIPEHQTASIHFYSLVSAGKYIRFSKIESIKSVFHANYSKMWLRMGSENSLNHRHRIACSSQL